MTSFSYKNPHHSFCDCRRKTRALKKRIFPQWFLVRSNIYKKKTYKGLVLSTNCKSMLCKVPLILVLFCMITTAKEKLSSTRKRPTPPKIRVTKAGGIHFAPLRSSLQTFAKKKKTKKSKKVKTIGRKRKTKNSGNGNAHKTNGSIKNKNTTKTTAVRSKLTSVDTVTKHGRQKRKKNKKCSTQRKEWEKSTRRG